MMTVLTRCTSTDGRALLFALFAALFPIFLLESWTTIILYTIFDRGRANNELNDQHPRQYGYRSKQACIISDM